MRVKGEAAPQHLVCPVSNERGSFTRLRRGLRLLLVRAAVALGRDDTREHVDNLSWGQRFPEEGNAWPRGSRRRFGMTRIEEKGEVPRSELLDRLSDRLTVQAQIDNGSGECWRLRGSSSAGGGVSNADCGTCRNKGLLQIKSDKRLVFDDENVLALKH